MSAKLTLRTDSLSPDLLRRLKTAKNTAPIMASIGSTLVSLGQRAFTDASLRPATWAARKVEPKDGHLILQDETNLRKSLRVTSSSARQVTIGSHLPYAAAHQLGNPKGNLPARPYLPFLPDGTLTPRANKNVESIIRAALK